jgi:hopanoid biosynthesis associated RND transporter like protein HpnN
LIDAAAAAWRRVLVRWVELTARFALGVVLAAVLLTAVAGAYVAGNFSINTSVTDMLSPDLPFRHKSRQVSEAFPQFSDNIVVVIDGVTADLADDGAARLAALMREKPDIFGAVHDPAGDPYFRRNGLLYLDVDELSDLGDRLAEAQPYLGKLWRDPSLGGLGGMLGLAIDDILKDTEAPPPIELDTFLNAMAEVAEAQARGQYLPLSWRRLMTGDDGGKRRILLIQPALDFGSLSPASEAMESIRRLAAEAGLDAGHGLRVRLTGSAALATEELQSVEEGMGLAAVLSLVLVVGLLFVGLGSVRLALAVLVTLVMGLIWTAGFAFAAIGQLNLISVAFAVLFIGLSVDFGIHFGLRYAEGIDRGRDHRRALAESAEGVGGALTLAAVAAAIAFYSFSATDYLGLAELGQIAGTGMFIALFANLTVLPALLSLAPPAPGPGRVRRGPKGLIRGPARAVAAGALVLGVGAAVAASGARFDFDPLNLKNTETESVSTLFDMMEDSRTSPYSITVLSPDLDAARELAEKLDRLDLVEETETLADYVPTGQDEKLDIIASMALFLIPALTARPVDTPALDRPAATEALRGKLRRLGALADGPVPAAARRLEAALSVLAGPGAESALAELESRLLSALPGRIEALRRSLEAEPVALEDLPDGLRQRSVAADGRAKITVYPKENLHDREALERFVAVVRGLAPDATGSPVVILEAGNTVIAAFRDAALIAVVSIALLLAVLLRSARDIFLVFAPLTLAALLTVAASALFNLPFNFANVIVLPLLFGLGVAGAIHLVVRERSEGAGALETSTPRAVMFSALTTIGSFGSIALSSHPGTSSMGMLLTIAISMTLACTLIVLPALMEIMPRKETD